MKHMSALSLSSWSLSDKIKENQKGALERNRLEGYPTKLCNYVYSIIYLLLHNITDSCLCFAWGYVCVCDWVGINQRCTAWKREINRSNQINNNISLTMPSLSAGMRKSEEERLKRQEWKWKGELWRDLGRGTLLIIQRALLICRAASVLKEDKQEKMN